MAEADPAQIHRPTPLDIDARLRSRVTEAVIAQGGIRHEALNAFLRERLAGTDVAGGSLFAEPTIEAASGYETSGKTPRDLEGSLLHSRLVAALTDGEEGDDYRFTHPAYQHQLESWRALSRPERRSVLVSSGTGSGKTECFLVPMLDDLAREVDRKGGRLTGVHALMLYPLNALIASQEERLKRWVRPFHGDIRFALYNGLMGDARESECEQAVRDRPEQVIYRTTLRDDPPPILVTNNTMLEYMTIRRADRPIVEASQGKLRWIIIDEAHSYVGSAAAEVALLLRRVMEAFSVDPAQVRFVATSATIGEGEGAELDLRKFLADLAGVAESQVEVIMGKPATVTFDGSGSTSDPLIQRIIRTLEEKPATVSEVEKLAANDKRDAVELLGSMAASRSDDRGPLLPMRVHKFIRAIPGLWSCLNPECAGGKPDGWPYGAILFEDEDRCPHCHSPQFEIVSCRECGEPWLQAINGGNALLPVSSKQDRDEFAAASARELDSEEDGEPDEQVPAVSSGPLRLIATRPCDSNSLLTLSVDLKTGTLPERRDAGSPIQASKADADDGCPRCGAAHHKDRPSPIWPFRFGAPFLIQNAAPTMLEGVAGVSSTAEELPADGRRLLSFTDSRQGTARFAANIETMAERGFVRAWVYHAVQQGAGSAETDLEQRAELERRLAKLKPHAGDPTFDQLISETEVALEGTSAVAPIPWRKAVRGLAAEPMVKNWIGAVWDEDRDARFAKDRESLANFLLLRELARRPRRANAIETLGLAKLIFPPIETLRETQVPEQLRRVGRTLSDWKDFQYFLIDTIIRNYFVLTIDRADQRWLLPRHSRVREIVGPNEDRRNLTDRVWPFLRGADLHGAKSNAVLAIETGLNLDAGQPQDRADINEILQKAWDQLRPLLKGAGSTYQLSLDRAALSPVREAWLCPVTNRILPRLVFGRTPYSLRGFGRAAGLPQQILLPRLPLSFPSNDAERNELAAFVERDAEIAALRARGVWGNLHDRAATFAPYIRAEEHSAQQPPYRLRAFENEFKTGKINLLACSTTMEMGVDIGSIESVLNTNVPPSIANYRQRVGRAGRRGQGFASSLTFARNTPLEREAFRDPAGYLIRKLRAPKIKLDSERIVQRHVNALLLARWFAEAAGELTKTRAGDFFGFPQGLGIEPDPNAPGIQFCRWLKQPSTRKAVSGAISRLVRGTALESMPGLPDETARMFEVARDDFGRQWQALRDQAKDVAEAARKSIENTVRRMCREFLLRELANRSLLPGHGFPTAVVPFITDCREAQTRERKRDDEEGGETRRNRRYDYPSRNADIAIREYAPGAEVVVDGLVWTSAGVQLNWQRPANEKASDIEDIRWSWLCGDCGEAGCDRRMANECPACGSAKITSLQFLEPAGFRVDWNSQPHAETDQVRYIEPQPPRVSAHLARWEPLLDPALGRVRATGDGLVFHYSLGTSGSGYRVCLDCGRAAEENEDALSGHTALMPPKGEAGRCAGNDKTYAITRPLALGHEVLTDVAELQPADLEDPGAAWALASALREALSRRLGVETRELGLSVAPRQTALGTFTHSIFLYDLASGGAGYSPRILDDLTGLLREANGVLTCKLDCQRGCSACVLVTDLYAQQEIIDRQAARAFLAPLLAALANPEDGDVVAPDSALSPPVADALARRLGPGSVATIFANDVPDLSALAKHPFVALFADAERKGSTVRIALPAPVIGDLDEAQRFGLRNLAQRHRFELGIGAVSPMPNGASLIAAIENPNGVVGWFSRDQSATLLREGWGIGSLHPVVSAPLTTQPIVEAVDPELLERKPRIGDRVKILTNDPGRPLRQFGVGLVNRVLKDELDAIGLWKPGKLVELTYSDRYLKAPLPLTLLMRTVVGLRDALAPKDAVLRLSIATSRIGEDRYRNGCHRLRDNWPDDDARADIVFAVADYFGFDIQYDDGGAPHARKLTIIYDDGSSAVLLFDQGFGYWRAQGNDQHNFREGASAQAKSLVDSSAFIIGNGETYIAIKQG
ncbi:DEAD/DEAH box helicase [Hephaestia sp. GCM10023244]|uniref:DEAD/DEAH box helicase n=1 Tax=unclassified Hephaestia TaxID=2631281 RepID=UPI0020770190|nr:DEAD/DEAH box helicase [Hephaestia sp. MAHUQ-44]MCM8730911.1 DEAD/DEAH box helicase [Hephaestia sp. MAHUQ-44]